MQAKQKKIIHVIPYDGIGGVETACKSVNGLKEENLNIEIFCIFPAPIKFKDFSIKNIGTYTKAAQSLRKIKPDLIVISLWRSALVCLLARLLGCEAQFVLFIHNTRDAHFVDKWVTNLTAKIAEEIWADSRATLSQRFKDGGKFKNTRTISYIPDYLKENYPKKIRTDPSDFSFIYWGRISKQKQLAVAIQFFFRIRKKRPAATFKIIGPHGDGSGALIAEIKNLDLEDCVSLVGPCNWQSIVEQSSQSIFFLQTSLYEGMSLAVVEAMHLGLVPVVFPVGEISAYTVNGVNAVWIPQQMENWDRCIALLCEIADKSASWQMMSTAAQDQWRNSSTYRDEYVAAAKNLLSSNK